MVLKWGKQSVTVLLVALLVMLAAACGKSNSAATGETGGSGESQGAKNETIKLQIMWWGSQPRHDVTLKALELYTKHHPNITFEPTFSGWDGYWDKLATLAAAKNAPDIIQMDAAYLPDYVKRNQLADLTGFDTTGIEQSLVDAGTFDGKLYAIPLGVNARGMVYNKAEVERLGITPPKAGWTWDDFFNFAKEAKSKLGEGKYGIPDLSKDRESYDHYQLSKGKGNLFLDGKYNLDKDTWMEWMRKFEELRKEGIVPPAEVMSTDKSFDAQFDLMANGTVLLRPLHAAQPGAMDSLMPGKVAVVDAPSGGGWLKPTFFFSVSQDSKYKEEAKEFIYWFLNDLEAGKIMGTQRGVPVVQKVVDEILPDLPPADLLGKEMIDMTAKSSTHKFMVAPAGWTEYFKEYEVVTEAVMYNKMTIEEAYEKITNKAKEIEENTKE